MVLGHEGSRFYRPQGHFIFCGWSEKDMKLAGVREDEAEERVDWPRQYFPTQLQ